MNAKLLQDTIDFVSEVGCNTFYHRCNGPTMRPVRDQTCPRCALLARLLHAQKTYKPRSKRSNLHLNLTKES